MKHQDIQQTFFQKIKEIIPPHLSMVDEIATLLDISTDSAYRRIRGEKSMNFEEIQKLSVHFRISLDQFLNLQTTELFSFRGQLKSENETSFLGWLENVNQNFQYFASFDHKHMYVLMKDVLPFEHFQIPELAKFKCYYWMKSILYYNSLKSVKFDIEKDEYDKYLGICDKIVESYCQIPVTQIWNVESINSSIHQILFFHEAGMIKNVTLTKHLLDKLEILVNHIETQAELGRKYDLRNGILPSSPGFRVFVNELILGDNTFFIELNESRMVFLNHSVVYYIATADPRFTASMQINLENLIRTSTMISAVGEKERVKFFNRLRKKISNARAQL